MRVQRISTFKKWVNSSESAIIGGLVDWGNWLLCCQKIYKNAEKPIAFDGHLWDNVGRFKDIGYNED